MQATRAPTFSMCAHSTHCNGLANTTSLKHPSTMVMYSIIQVHLHMHTQYWYKGYSDRCLLPGGWISVICMYASDAVNNTFLHNYAAS